jgi:AraC family transcriptional regulator, ethanolamine operon transcriptional activator
MQKLMPVADSSKQTSRKTLHVPLAPVRKRCNLERFSSGAIISVDKADFEEFCDFAIGWNIDHQLIGRTKPDMNTYVVMTPDVQLAMVQSSAGYSSQGQNPKGSMSIAVPLDESRPMVHCGHNVDGPEMAVVRTGQGFELVNRSGAHHLVASFSESRLEQYAADIWGDPDLLKHTAYRLRFKDREHRLRFVDAYQTILGDVQKRPSLLEDRRVAALLEDRLLENLLLHGHTDPQQVNESSRRQVARMAYRYLQENINEVPSIRKLCAATHSSYMTLERGFRETYGMPPLAHLKALRLSRARRELLHPDLLTTVTDVALHWGFLELGRFSVNYRMRFGESPSDTLRRAKGEFVNLARHGFGSRSHGQLWPA